MERYNLQNIRAFLSKGLTDEELRCLCYDAPGFKDVYNQLGPNTSKAQVIQWLIEYADRHLQMEPLLALAKEYNPARYERHQPYYEVGADLTISNDADESSPPRGGVGAEQAVIIGVGADLPVTVQDAKALADLLVDPTRCAFPPDQVHLLIEASATRPAILATLDRLAQDSKPDTTTIVYFAGHGYRIQWPGQSEAFYLLPYGYNLEDLPNTAISGIEFIGKLQAIQTKKLLVLLDCCHANNVGQQEANGVVAINSPLPPQIDDLLNEGSGQVILASSRADEYSHVNTSYSEFAIALMEGLAGADVIEKDGYVRVLDVALYVSRRVSNRTDDKQHPILKVANLEHNFTLAYYAGGSTEPLPLQSLPLGPPQEGGGEGGSASPLLSEMPSGVMELERDLAEGYRNLIGKYRRNLLEIDAAMAEFIDQRAVPPDLLHARKSILQRLAELEESVR